MREILVMSEVKPESLVKPEAMPEPLVKPEAMPEPLVKHEAMPEPLVKPESKPESLVKPESKPESKRKRQSLPDLCLGEKRESKQSRFPYVSNFDRCDCDAIHVEVVEAIRKKLVDDETLCDLAELFKIFGDFTRVKILSALQHSEMCVCDIAALLNMTKSAVSHQLRQLRLARLVKFRREGKEVYYSFDDDHVVNIFEQGLSHVTEGGVSR